MIVVKKFIGLFYSKIIKKVLKKLGHRIALLRFGMQFCNHEIHCYMRKKNYGSTWRFIIKCVRLNMFEIAFVTKNLIPKTIVIRYFKIISPLKTMVNQNGVANWIKLWK